MEGFEDGLLSFGVEGHVLSLVAVGAGEYPDLCNRIKYNTLFTFGEFGVLLPREWRWPKTPTLNTTAAVFAGVPSGFLRWGFEASEKRRLIEGKPYRVPGAFYAPTKAACS